MTIEQDKTLQALQIAIQMEIDGKEFYLKTSRESSNELGRKLLESLSAEEDIHRQKFEKIYEAIQGEKTWPAMELPPEQGQGLRTVFAEATSRIGSDIKPRTTELEAVETAMAMENKTYDYYKSQEDKTVYDAEKDFYDKLAAVERGHHQILLDYYEFLKDPAGWFVKKEHPSLDGG